MTEILAILLLIAGGVVVYQYMRIRKMSGQLRGAEDERARLETQLENEKKTHRELSEQIELTFAKLAGEALSKNNDDFLKLAEERFQRLQQKSEDALDKRKDAVAHIIKPIEDALQKNKQTIDRIEEQRNKAYGSITEQIESMTRDQNKLREDTNKLVAALHHPRMRGLYGEITLRRVIELAGMQSFCDFTEQASIAGESGALRPDVIAHMPNDRSLIIDAKTPLENYLNAMDTGDAGARKEYLDKYARDVATHIKQLSEKSYWSQVKQTPDFVVMFIPADQFLQVALEQQNNLLETAMERKIILATPGSLMGLLRAVAYGWQQETLAKNLLKVRDLGKELHDRIRVFVGHLDKVGTNLNRSVGAYNDAISSFEKRLIPTTQKLKDYGINPKEEIVDVQAVESLASVSHDESGADDDSDEK